ncbi:uncharacterized protein LOC113508354 [Trichoplusia ni]|uniref:Uncharacterized protein LOC113508354 n=1 Tax=Trichoplusia ni TaxID=7111 RepID=A0A7E5X3X9_TRINI|nr:uncharacterized protein LOC113508354 [Trichoplusia ni]
MEYQDDDDDDSYDAVYENGRWVWDDVTRQLVYKKEAPEVPQERVAIAVAILGSVEFREDIDLNEQQRFRKRIQRKIIEGNDVVTLQDIKDVVLFTAPPKIVKPVIIHLLHLPATERLLRALIFFCQYYLQTLDLMSLRTLELLGKIRTPKSDETEFEFLENLQDLRLLVAKEYSNVIMGFGEFAKLHHMGALKKSRSLSKRESLVFETFIRISIQIIWIALGRKSFSQIEIEVNRIFKSSIFNSAEHKLSKETKNKLAVTNPNEKAVLLGQCMQKRHKVNVLSPLMDEVHCHRYIDHRIYGLGIIKYPSISPRHRYLENAISLPEHQLEDVNMSVGILGLPRENFDILLKEIKFISASSSNVSVNKQPSRPTNVTKSMRKSLIVAGPTFKDIVIPSKQEDDYPLETCPDFPTESMPRRPCDELQRQKWMKRIQRIQYRQRAHQKHV